MSLSHHITETTTVFEIESMLCSIHQEMIPMNKGAKKPREAGRDVASKITRTGYGRNTD